MKATMKEKRGALVVVLLVVLLAVAACAPEPADSPKFSAYTGLEGSPAGPADEVPTGEAAVDVEVEMKALMQSPGMQSVVESAAQTMEEMLDSGFCAGEPLVFAEASAYLELHPVCSMELGAAGGQMVAEVVLDDGSRIAVADMYVSTGESQDRFLSLTPSSFGIMEEGAYAMVADSFQVAYPPSGIVVGTLVHQVAEGVTTLLTSKPKALELKYLVDQEFGKNALRLLVRMAPADGHSIEPEIAAIFGNKAPHLNVYYGQTQTGSTLNPNGNEVQAFFRRIGSKIDVKMWRQTPGGQWQLWKSKMVNSKDEILDFVIGEVKKDKVKVTNLIGERTVSLSTTQEAALQRLWKQKSHLVEAVLDFNLHFDLNQLKASLGLPASGFGKALLPFTVKLGKGLAKGLLWDIAYSFFLYMADQNYGLNTWCLYNTKFQGGAVKRVLFFLTNANDSETACRLTTFSGKFFTGFDELPSDSAHVQIAAPAGTMAYLVPQSAYFLDCEGNAVMDTGFGGDGPVVHACEAPCSMETWFSTHYKVDVYCPDGTVHTETSMLCPDSPIKCVNACGAENGACEEISSCGDGQCDDDENSCDCPADCPDDPQTCSACECGDCSGACCCDPLCLLKGDCCENACVQCGSCDPVVEPPEDGECVEGETACADKETLLTCVAGAWAEFGCSDSACEEAGYGASVGCGHQDGGYNCLCEAAPIEEPPCADGERYCETIYTLMECEGGVWVTHACSDQSCFDDGYGPFDKCGAKDGQYYCLCESAPEPEPEPEPEPSCKANGELCAANSSCCSGWCTWVGGFKCADPEPEPEPDADCDNDEWECDNGKCIPEGWLCDQWDDCGDDSDEATDLCPEEEPEPACVSGERYCADNDTLVMCQSGEWVDVQCSDQSCLDDGYGPFDKCGAKDGQYYCLCESEPEPEPQPEPSCKANGELCATNSSCCSGLCTWFGGFKCADPEPEPEPEPECDDDEWECDNGECIPEGWVCDDDDECGDGSDEAATM